jgi:endoglucanase Acf2
MGEFQKIGAGDYAIELPEYANLPKSNNGQDINPAVVSNFKAPIPTNDWSSSIVYHFETPYSEVMYANPLILKANSKGLEIGHTLTPEILYEDETEEKVIKTEYSYMPDLIIEVDGVKLTETKLKSYSDWAVTAHWGESGSHNSLDATFGHGMPFVYFSKKGRASVKISFEVGEIRPSINDQVYVIYVDDKFYAVFLPNGSQCNTNERSSIESSLGGKDYFSIALLPDGERSTIEYFYNHAYNFITDTKIDFEVDTQTLQVTTKYEVSIVKKEENEGSSDKALLTLYPHQYKHIDTEVSGFEYNSPRGKMQLIESDSFFTKMQFTGVLPAIPNLMSQKEGKKSLKLKNDDSEELLKAIDLKYNELEKEPIIKISNSLGAGRELERLSELVQICHQVGKYQERDLFLTVIKTELEDWFTASDGTQKQFYYNDKWNTMQAYPESHHSASQINNHHIHYANFVKAAAVVAQFDPDWAKQENWGGMVNLIIRDVAALHNDKMFPFLRNFDPYEGHSWSSGHANFSLGNMQEDPTASINFAYAVILWGALTNNKELHDLGIYLHTTETESVKTYWFNKYKNGGFPEYYPYQQAGTLWGGGIEYSAHFSAEIDSIYGSALIPMNGGTLYLGEDPEYIKDIYEEIIKLKGIQEDVYKDLIWEFQSFSNPDDAIRKYKADPAYSPSFSESKAHTWHFISNIKQLGHVETSVTANHPFAVVFVKNDVKTYVAYNHSNKSKNILFSDGRSFEVKANTMLAYNDSKLWTVEYPGVPQEVLPESDLVIDHAIGTKQFSIGKPFSFTIPEDTFKASNKEKLLLKAALSNGNPLPSWLKFDPNTMTFSGIPITLENIDINLEASDGIKNVMDTLSLVIGLENSTNDHMDHGYSMAPVINIYIDKIEVKVNLAGLNVTNEG